MYTINHLLHIDATQEKVFKALTTIEGLQNWWTKFTEGNPDGLIKFSFNEPFVIMQVSKTIPNEKIVWEVAEGNFGWDNHWISITLDENNNKTRVRFTHENWVDNKDHYAACNFSWGKYLESLRKYCETGTGSPFGSEEY